MDLESSPPPDSSDDRRAYRPFISVVASFATAPIVCRLWLVLFPQHPDTVHTFGSALLENFRGVFEDVAIALFLACAIGLIATTTLRRLVFAVILLAWSVLYYGQYEHVADLGASLHYEELRYALTGAFLRGSASAVLAPGLCILLVAGALIAAAAVTPPPLRARRFLAHSLPAMGCAALLAFWPVSLDQRLWPQRNLLVENVQSAWEALGVGNTAVSNAAMEDLARKLQSAPEDGPARFNTPKQKRNILLLILEGIPGPALDPIAAEHGLKPTGLMPFLSNLAEQGLLYTNFITQDRHTDRGEFGILCGQYSNAYGMPQMSEYASCGGAVCLPQMLKENGYHTEYDQAAPLEFMLKASFMPAAGFSEAHGTDWFTKAHLTNGWGIDDRSLFEAGAERVKSLTKLPNPWFLAMLTVGTHHPYLIPDEIAAQFPDRSAASMRYLDGALQNFFQELQSSGSLKDTLVLITSDESHGFPNENPVLELLSYNWGFLLALPDVSFTAAHVKEPYQQIDIAPTVLNYVGLAEARKRFSGSDAFAQADPARPLYFANHLGSRIYFAHDGRLTISSLSGGARKNFSFGHLDLFTSTMRQIADIPERQTLFQAMRDSLRSTCSEAAQQTVTLFPKGVKRFGGVDVSGMWIMGGQHMRVPEKSHLSLDLSFDYRRGNSTDRDPGLFHVRLTRGEEDLKDIQCIMPSGSRTSIHYEFNTERDLQFFNVNGLLHQLAAHDEWDVREAKISHRPMVPTDQEFLLYTLENGETTFRVWDTDSFPTADCVKNHRSIERCPQQFVILSPLFSLPAHSQLVLRSNVRGITGNPRVFVEVSSEDGETVQYRSTIAEISSGQSETVSVSADTGDGQRPLQFRLGWVPSSDQDSAELEDATVTLSAAVPR
ncbi:MAG: LTA synthase family protein [Bdellovibrionota bacterium]